MALVIDDRVRETTTVTGTNDATLLGAVTGFQAFSVIGNGNTTYYTISDQTGGNFEVGIGTFSSIGPTLARTTILSSSNGGAKVSFPAGTKDVFVTYPSSRAVYEDAAGNMDGFPITGGSINNTPIGATTASTGRFSTLTNAALTSGRVTFAGTAGVLQDDADFTFNGTTVTMANDASISGLTVGKGGGAVASNTAVGASALASNSGGANTAVGSSALVSNTSGTNNVSVGANALDANTSGNQNTAIGGGAIGAATTADSNTAIGYLAMRDATTGAENSALGVAALLANTTGANNTAFGRSALQNNTTASNNTAVGFQAGFSNTTGADNTLIGMYAGYSTTTGSDNTFVGHSAGFNTTDGTGTFNTCVGSNSGDKLTTGSKNTIIGSYTGNADGLDIRTASNYAVISDGDGNRQITMKEGQTLALDSAVPAAGTGITFPATQSASSDANTLDDYEEGTFTPTIIGTTTAGTGTYVNQDGGYVKIGKQVNVRGFIHWSAHTGTGSMRLAGLPFTCDAIATTGCVSEVGNFTLTANNILTIQVAAGTTEFAFSQTPVGGGGDSVVALDTEAYFRFSATYYV